MSKIIINSAAIVLFSNRFVQQLLFSNRFVHQLPRELSIYDSLLLKYNFDIFCNTELNYDFGILVVIFGI